MTEQTYQIRVKGWIDNRWADWFSPLTLATGRADDGTPITTLAGPVADQAALRGTLAKL